MVARGGSQIDLRRDSRSPLAVRSPTFLVCQPKPNLLIDNPLASGSRVTLEEGREPRLPQKGVKEDEGRKELEVGVRPFSSSGVFFSLRDSVNRAGGTDVGGNKTTMKRLQRRIPRRLCLILLKVRPQWVPGSMPPHPPIL